MTAHCRLADYEDQARPWGDFSLWKITGSTWVEHVGHFSCSDGLVAIWQLEYADHRADLTCLTTVSEGLRRMRTWDRVWSRRTLPRLCLAFLADCFR